MAKKLLFTLLIGSMFASVAFAMEKNDKKGEEKGANTENNQNIVPNNNPKGPNFFMRNWEKQLVKRTAFSTVSAVASMLAKPLADMFGMKEYWAVKGLQLLCGLGGTAVLNKVALKSWLPSFDKTNKTQTSYDVAATLVPHAAAFFVSDMIFSPVVPVEVKKGWFFGR